MPGLIADAVRSDSMADRRHRGHVHDSCCSVLAVTGAGVSPERLIGHGVLVLKARHLETAVAASVQAGTDRTVWTPQS